MSALYAIGLFVAGVIVLGGGASLAWLWLQRHQFTPLHAHDAIMLVWRECYGQDSAPPRVIWIKTADGRFNSYGKLVWGEAPTPWACNVGWWDGARFFQSALAHELWHCCLQRRGGDTPDHTDMGFLADGMVARANVKLHDWEATLK